MANLAPSWRPKRVPNRGQNLQKSTLKNSTFSISIFSSVGPHFGRFFGRFFGSKSDENLPNTFLAKTLKIVVFLRENRYFQSFEDNKDTKTIAKKLEKFYVFGDLVFGGILGGFWKCFGTPKSSIFEFLSWFFRSKV